MSGNGLGTCMIHPVRYVSTEVVVGATLHFDVMLHSAEADIPTSESMVWVFVTSGYKRKSNAIFSNESSGEI